MMVLVFTVMVVQMLQHVIMMLSATCDDGSC